MKKLKAILTQLNFLYCSLLYYLYTGNSVGLHLWMDRRYNKDYE